MSEPVTISITRRVDPEREKEATAWARAVHREIVRRIGNVPLLSYNASDDSRPFALLVAS